VNPKKTEEVKNRSIVMERLKKDGVEFFLDPDGTPCVHVSTDRTRKDWEVNEQRVQDLLVVTYHEQTGYYPSSGQLALLNAHIRELCRMGAERPSQQAAVETEKDPNLIALVEIVNLEGGFRGLTSSLHEKALKVQEKSFTSNMSQISPFLTIFGKQNRRLVTALKEYRIHAEFGHTEQGSTACLTRMDGFQVEPIRSKGNNPDGNHHQSATEPSVATAGQGKSLDANDDADGSVKIDKDAKNNPLIEHAALAMISADPIVITAASRPEVTNG